MEWPVWAEVSLKAISHNMREVRRLITPGTKIMAVVKANAYGHGAAKVAPVVLKEGADYLAVARVKEGIVLRETGIDAPILVLGYTPFTQFKELMVYDLAQTIYTQEMAALLAQEAAKQKKQVNIHFKIDTGMGRLGFLPAPETLKEILSLARLPYLEIEGIFTHLASADEKNKSVALSQIAKYCQFIEDLKKEGLDIPLRHCANSAAVIDLPQTHLNMVRPGIMIYGLYPSLDVNTNHLNLRPAMSFKARIAQVKKVPAGFKVSYGSTWSTPKPTVIATLPVGYADGYSRLLSSKGQVLIHGQRASVVGRVCMDMCMVDVGHIPDVYPGEEAVLFGTQEGTFLPVEEVASLMGTINYEVVCMVNDRVPRVYW
ncbi:alanine racemase [Peptococcaceae bacterium SCADC1_2_3]|jgi:alanine racemase|nr:alanine racemase [Peptococcaceae bacterium SCADC1_2_3]KFI36298.1 alanine racemase [Peptococcaceae bacterium SCADC1_2_3]KFI37053.1 alanine racemase [Peptococcaceae bacterium SCADC1_2_3]HBQ28403.1 alanine racemase [Desulfotomaculum sp.]